MQIYYEEYYLYMFAKFILKVKSGVRLSARWSNREVSSVLMPEYFWSVITSGGLKEVSQCENMEIALSSKNLTACALIAPSAKVSHF